MICINDYLNEILEDFQEYVESGEKLCKLKDVHFDAGRLPDYSDINVQQLYLLRYAYAYAFEYKRMYMHLKKMLPDMSQLSVTSVGCGSMIDYWSLAHVFPKSCCIHYIGVDVIDWDYKLNGRKKDKVEFIKADFVDLISKHDIIPTDIYIFPKSISEFSSTNINRICDALSSLIPDDKPVYFLFSLRTNENSHKIDAEKTTLLYTTMVKLGFSSKEKPNVSFRFNEEIQGEKICDVDDDFDHPRDVVNFLINELPTCCNHYDECTCNDNCKDRLGRWPILSCKQIRYKVFKFVKEAKP